MRTQHSKTFKLVLTGLFAALCFVSFTFLQIKIPIPGGDATSLHIGNAFCVLAALTLGGWYGGLAGAIGMTIADLFDPVYILVAPKTFILKLCIGLITGYFAHRIAKIHESNDKKYILKWTTLSAVSGLGFNVIFDPIVGYFYKMYILGQPQEIAKVLAKLSAFTTFANAVISTILVVFMYSAVRRIVTKQSPVLPTESNKVVNQ
ncbi:MAG: ECF transporter S component [Clostridium sp.]